MTTLSLKLNDALQPVFEEFEQLLSRPAIPPEHAEEYERCSSDVVYWVNTYCQTYDPRLAPDKRIMPFALFPRQEEFLLWLAEREDLQEDGLAAKSRDMGVTWLCCAYVLHGWLFKQGFAAGFGSRKLELVDKIGDPKCIFEKIRFMLSRLPAWQKPVRFADNIARLVNYDNGSSIVGEGGDQIGRGGRQSVYIIDESAFLEHADRIERSLFGVTNVRIDVSTPNGPGNPFATKHQGGVVNVFAFHWRDDPRKGQAWYDEQCRIKDPITIAQELEIDFSASVEGITIPARWVQCSIGLRLPAGSAPLVAGLDIAAGGKNKTVFQPRHGPLVEMPVVWSTGTSDTAYRVVDEMEKRHGQQVHYDVGGVGINVQDAFNKMTRRPQFATDAIQSGAPPTETLWPSGNTSKELFLNRRAELWWMLRRRFEKTFEFVVEGKLHPLDELISIPNCPQLIAQLSMPLCFRMDTGKIKIESKEDMSQRGVQSPDYADALVYAFAHDAPDWQEALEAATQSLTTSQNASSYARNTFGPIW
jgi:phage terminase large subunit